MKKEKEERKTTTTFIIWPLLAGFGLTAWFLWGRRKKLETVTFYGKVTDLQTGGSLGNVRVTLDSLFQYTDSDGNYLFEDLNPGTYTVLFEKDGYDTEQGEVDLKLGENILNIALSPIVWEMPEYELAYVEEWTHLGDVADWDFRTIAGDGTWELSDSQFVSPPTSLYLVIKSPAKGWIRMICNRPEFNNLQQGQLYSWIFGVEPIFGDYRFYGFIYGYKSPSDFRYIALPFEGWHRFRLSWWNAIGSQNEPVLAVRVDEYHNNEWHEGQVQYEERLSGTTNRVGLIFDNYYSGVGWNYGWYDDTEIWVLKK
jgi:hypothetical protein